MRIEDLTSIYQIVCAAEAGAAEAGTDPFENPKIQHLRKPLQEYLSRQPDRHKALSMQPRIVSDPEEDSVEFDLLVVPADPTRNIKEVSKRLKTQILYHEVQHYRVLAEHFKHLPSAVGFNEEEKMALVLLLEFEIRYRRGCDICWVGESLFSEPASGPL